MQYLLPISVTEGLNLFVYSKPNYFIFMSYDFLLQVFPPHVSTYLCIY